MGFPQKIILSLSSSRSIVSAIHRKLPSVYINLSSLLVRDCSHKGAVSPWTVTICGPTIDTPISTCRCNDGFRQETDLFEPREDANDEEVIERVGGRDDMVRKEGEGPFGVMHRLSRIIVRTHCHLVPLFLLDSVRLLVRGLLQTHKSNFEGSFMAPIIEQ